MTREELMEKLGSLKDRSGRDTEHDHLVADEALLSFIDDQEIRAAYELVGRWYA